MVANTACAEALLVEQGAGRIEHPGGTLLAHLRRVAQLLGTWGAGEDAEMAGLCHACYGTDGFAVALLTPDERPLLRDVIGSKSEALVYLYGSCDRSFVYPGLGRPGPIAFRSRFTKRIVTVSEYDAAAFVELTAANELDIATHNAVWTEEASAQLLELFTRARRHLSAAAWSDCEAVLTPAGVA